MKYEEWIKYEESRKKMKELKPWVLLEPEILQKTQVGPPAPREQEKGHFLSAILQVFSPRST